MDDPRLQKAMDGWGNPLQVEGPPGWDWYWVSALDQARWNRRPWTMCKWGVDKVTINGVSGNGVKKGTAITFNELTLYKMRSEHGAAMHAADPNRLRHKALWEYAQAISETGFTHPVAHGGQPDDDRPHSAGRAGVHPVSDRNMQFVHQQFDLR
jgi:hypothetical protein